MNPVQLPSGVGVSPNRAATVNVVDAGTTAVHLARVQLAGPPIVITLDRNVPDVAYGVRRSQSTVNEPPPGLESETIGRNRPPIVTARLATSTPSMKNVTDALFQSMRIGVRRAQPAAGYRRVDGRHAVVRARVEAAASAPVLKIAQGT